MSPAAAATTAKVSFPARCAVAVICGDHLISQVYPASVPIETFLVDAVELMQEELKRRGAGIPESRSGYELHRANGVRLDVTRTLDELGIEDGATLSLALADLPGAFEPQCESLSTALARQGRELFAPVTTETAAQAALVIVAMTVLTTLALAIRVRIADDSVVPAFIVSLIGALAVGAAAAVNRWWPNRQGLTDGFGWLSVPMVAFGIAGLLPGDIGSAQVGIAALGLAFFSSALYRFTRRHLRSAATVVAICGLIAVAAAVRMWQPVPAQWLGMCTLVALVTMLTAGPTVALWVADIHPPHFGSITGRDLFRRCAGMPDDAVGPVADPSGVDDDANLDLTARGTEITQAAIRANAVLSGICNGTAVVLPAAAWTVLVPGQERSIPAAILVVLLIVIFISRARAFSDRYQAVALVIGGCSAACCGIAKYTLNQPISGDVRFMVASLVLCAFGIAAMFAAIVVPITRFTPMVRMIAEWLEIVAIIIALPLAAWISGLFAWVRMR